MLSHEEGKVKLTFSNQCNKLEFNVKIAFVSRGILDTLYLQWRISPPRN